MLLDRASGQPAVRRLGLRAGGTMVVLVDGGATLTAAPNAVPDSSKSPICQNIN